MLSWQLSTNNCQVIHEVIQRINFNNYCKKKCLHKVSLLYMILWWTGMATGVLRGHLLM